jgi:hypothetical protein
MKEIYLKALEYIEEDDWVASHRLIQDYTDPWSCCFHGYLHWLEGDIGNAQYWYQRANVKFPQTSLSVEFNKLVSEVNAMDD